MQSPNQQWESEMTHLPDLIDTANSWLDIHRSRPDEAAQLAYYRFLARRLRKRAQVRVGQGHNNAS